MILHNVQYSSHSVLLRFNDMSSVVLISIALQPPTFIPDSTSPHTNPLPVLDDTNFSFPSPFENNLPLDYNVPASSHAHYEAPNATEKKHQRSESEPESPPDTTFIGAPHDKLLDEGAQPTVTHTMASTGHDISDGPPPSKLSRKEEIAEGRRQRNTKRRAALGVTPTPINLTGGTKDSPAETEEAETEEGSKVNPPKAPKTKAKRIVRAKESIWADIPDWQGRGDCPVLALPLELLDRCFGHRGDLFVSRFTTPGQGKGMEESKREGVHVCILD